MTANWDLIDDVLKGTAQFRSLNHSERQYAHAAIDAAIARRARETKLGRDLLAAGQTIVFLDADGSITKRSPGDTTEDASV